jgi:hypothetical protein
LFLAAKPERPLGAPNDLTLKGEAVNENSDRKSLNRCDSCGAHKVPEHDDIETWRRVGAPERTDRCGAEERQDYAAAGKSR